MSRQYNMISQLYISLSYVPIDTSVTLINAKIIDKLEEHGVNTIVLTVSAKDTNYTVTPALLGIFKSDRKVYRVRSYETGGNFLIFLRKVLRKIFPVIFFVPDYHFIWEFLAIIKLFKIRKESKIDIIHSVSAPHCSHIVGYFAKLILKKPWICHLDDYWVDNPFEHFSAFRIINVWLERMCFKKADVILSGSDDLLREAALRYPEEIKNKFLFIPVCYEDRLYPVEYKRSEKYEFIFLGKFYRTFREPFSLFEATSLIKKNNPDIYRKIRINLIGSNSLEYQRYVDEFGIEDVVECQGQVDYVEAMKRLKEASVMIHIGGTSNREDETITERKSNKLKEDADLNGRIFEALGAGRLILAITTPSGPVADFVRKYGIVCKNSDPEDIARAIVNIVSNYSLDDLYNWKYAEEVESYSCENIALKYRRTIEKLTTTVEITPISSGIKNLP